MHPSTLAHYTHAHTYTSSNTQHTHTQTHTHTHTHTHNTAHTHPPTHTLTPLSACQMTLPPPLSEGDISVATSASINSTFFAKVANWGKVF